MRLWPSALRLLLSDILWFARITHAEVRSFYNRICVLRDRRKTQTDRYDGIDLGPLLESALMERDHGFHPIEREALAAHLVPCRETVSRSRDIENLFSKYPWVSDGDILLFLEGWEMGTQSVHDSACSKNMETQQAYLLALKLAGLEPQPLNATKY